MAGYIKLYRQVLENPTVCKDGDHIAIWVYLLLNAAYKERTGVHNGKKIILNPGQLTDGRRRMSERLGISESKIQRVLKCFEIEQQIEQQMCAKNRLITVKNWDRYQCSEQQNEQQMNSDRTASEQLVNTNKEIKNIKKDKKERNSIFTPPSLEDVQAYCKERNNSVDADNWYDFYLSKGWMVGKNKMKDWKAAVRTWEKPKKQNTSLKAPKREAFERPIENYDHLAVNLFEDETSEFERR